MSLASAIGSATHQNYLANELRNHQVFRQRLLEEFPDLDEATLADTMEGLTNLREILSAVLRSALDDEAIARALAERTSEMKARYDRIAGLAKRKRQVVLEVMTGSEITKLVEPDFSASLRAGAPTLEVEEEARIPAAYWKPQPSKLDKVGILAALKTGTQIDGAVLNPPQTQLHVRIK